MFLYDYEVSCSVEVKWGQPQHACICATRHVYIFTTYLSQNARHFIKMHIHVLLHQCHITYNTTVSIVEPL